MAEVSILRRPRGRLTRRMKFSISSSLNGSSKLVDASAERVLASTWIGAGLATIDPEPELVVTRDERPHSAVHRLLRGTHASPIGREPSLGAPMVATLTPPVRLRILSRPSSLGAGVQRSISSRARPRTTGWSSDAQ